MEFSCIESCIYLDPKTYMHDTEISPETPKSVPPATYIEVFSARFEDHEGEEEMDHVRRQLASTGRALPGVSRGDWSELTGTMVESGKRTAFMTVHYGMLERSRTVSALAGSRQ